MWKLNTSTRIRSTLAVCVIHYLPYMYITLYHHRDSTGILESLNAMKHSTELPLSLIGTKKNIYESSSALTCVCHVNETFSCVCHDNETKYNF